MKKIKFSFFLYLIHFIVFFIGTHYSYAASGNISPTEKNAWSENIGWIYFRSNETGVTVHNDALSGYAWAENIGWIKMGAENYNLDTNSYLNTNPTNWGVNIDSGGNLSGFAWSENAGWIRFDTLTEKATFSKVDGVFSGFAWAENFGYVHLGNKTPTSYNLESPRISVYDSSSGEHFPSIVFEVKLNKPIPTDVLLDYETSDASAIADLDYIKGKGTVEISKGNTSAFITILLKDDDREENNEFFYINLSNPVGASFYIDQARGLIADNETHNIIMATPHGKGTISPSGGVPVPHHGNQTFTISPETEYHISDVKINGVSIGAKDTYQFENVTSDQNIDAYFDINHYTITSSAGANGSITPLGDTKIVSGNNLNFKISPDANHHVMSVKVDGISVGDVNEYLFEKIIEPHTIHATFEINKYSITTAVSGLGIVSPNQALVDHGRDQSFLITSSDESYRILDVLIDGVSVGPVERYNFKNVTKSHKLEAKFEIATFNISVTKNDRGKVLPVGPVTLKYKENQTFRFTPDRAFYSEECDIKDVRIDGKSIGSTPIYSFYKVTSDHSVDVEFYCTLKVCSDSCFYASIQDAIEAARDGDLIRVYPGTYKELVDLKGKIIRVEATDGETMPIIHANERGSAVKFTRKETSATVLSGFVITKGKADLGGGIYLDGASPEIVNCVITDNRSLVQGAAVFMQNSASPIFRQVKFQNNASSTHGAAIFVQSGSEPLFFNATVTNNTAVGNGGGLYVNNAQVSAYNCTIMNNRSVQGNGIYAENAARVLVHNSIVWNEDSVGNPLKIFNSSSQINVTYSDVWQNSGIYLGSGNINQNPLITTGYHLTLLSPCIDRASTQNAPSVDMDGETRGIGIDIGADEYGVLTPSANFYVILNVGYSPLNAQFNGIPKFEFPLTELSWDFGDGVLRQCYYVDQTKKWYCYNNGNVAGMIEDNPFQQYHQYIDPGKYSVTLSIKDKQNNTASLLKKGVVEVKTKASDLDFTSDISTGYKPVSINFVPHLETPANIVNWTWDFGDGIQSTVINPNHYYTVTGEVAHEYTRTGVFDVKLSVIDSDGKTLQRIRHDFVNISGRMPKADFWASPVSGSLPLDVQFYDTSTALDIISSREWDFGDNSAASVLRNPKHMYKTAGVYTVRLTIRAGDETDTKTRVQYIQVMENEPLITVCPLSDCHFAKIQTAINAASDGDTILVKDGTYKESIDFLGKAITVRSENGAETTIIDGQMTDSVVKFQNGETAKSILQGFTIQRGRADIGAGILIKEDSLLRVPMPTIVDCDIQDNVALQYGGGIAMNHANARILNCMIHGNNAEFGAGISVVGFSSPDLRFSNIYSNMANDSGGGVYIYSSSPVLYGLTIKGNVSKNKGGGIYAQDSAPQEMVNLLIVQNSSDSGGGIYFKNISSPLINYCTIADNKGPLAGNGILSSHSSLFVRNSIVINGGDEIRLQESKDVSVTYSDIFQSVGVFQGDGNINIDPKFIMTKEDYHLDQGSLCKNIGTIAGAPADDIDSDLRPVGKGYDIGADEAKNMTPVADSLSIAADEDIPIAFSLVATDEEGDPLKYDIVVAPQYGTLSGTAPDLIYTPNNDFFGSDFFTYIVNDGSLDSSIGKVEFTVLPVNDPPSFVKGDNQTIWEDSGEIIVTNWASLIRSGPENEKDQAIEFLVSADRPGMFLSLPKVSVSGNLSFIPAPNANGKARISIRLSDNAGTNHGGIDTSTLQEFTITIVPVNDRPTFVRGADLTESEDSGEHIVAGWATNILKGPSDEYGQSLTFYLTTDKPDLFVKQPAITPEGTLSYKLALNAFGTATVEVFLKDDGGVENGGKDISQPSQFRIIILPVNDPPSFVKGSDQIVTEDSGQRVISDWAINIVSGPSNEVDQLVNFQTFVDNSSLFVSLPVVSATGTLIFTPAENTNGSTRVRVELKDNGGTDNSGVDRSQIQEFSITILPVNDPPVFTKGNDVKIFEDAKEYIQKNWATQISPGPTDEAGQILTFYITTNNDKLFASGPSVSSDGTLSFIPSVNANGIAIVSVYLADSGGTEYNGDSTSRMDQFVVTIDSVNDPPSFIKGKDITIFEDAGDQIFRAWAKEIATGPSDEAGQNLTFHISTDNPSLFSSGPDIYLDGRLMFTTAANAFGTAIVSVYIEDNGGVTNGGNNVSTTSQFTIEVISINDPPTFAKGPDQNIFENGGTVTIPNWATMITSGPYNETNQKLEFQVMTNNNALFGRIPAITPEGTLIYTTQENVYGQAIVTVVLKDSGGTDLGGINVSPAQYFAITIHSVNNPPSFSIGLDQRILEDSGIQYVGGWATNIKPGPANESYQTVEFHLSTNNDMMFASLPKVSPNGDLSYTVLPDQFGQAVVTMFLQDSGDTLNGGENASQPQDFTITVVPVNDAPGFTKGYDVNVFEDSREQTIYNWASDVRAGPFNESDQVIEFVLTADNMTLFSDVPKITSNGSLIFTVMPDAFGTAEVSVYLKDNGLTANNGMDQSVIQKFSITIQSVNDKPKFRKGVDQIVLEDSVRQVISEWATGIIPGPNNEKTQNLIFNLNTTNENLFSELPNLSSNGRLAYTPAPDAHGEALVTVYLKDDGGVANGGYDTSDYQQFTIAILPVNDMPYFIKGADITALEDEGTITKSNWAQNISKGAAYESDQVLTFDVKSNNDALFKQLPKIGADGNLNFVTAQNAFGTAVLTVYLKDNGGTEFGGTDTSPTQSFRITVLSVNDRPNFEIGSAHQIMEDAGAQTVEGWITQISQGPSNETGQVVSFQISTNNDAMFKVKPTISAEGTLTYVPADSVNGEVQVTVILKDTGGKENGGEDTSLPYTSLIKILPVNDRPSFTKGANQSVLEDSGIHIVPNWASSINAGSSDETNQKLRFVVESNNTKLFTTMPTINADGVLTYTPATHVNGSATLTIYLKDDGGTLNGGNDTSLAAQCVIQVLAVNDPPDFVQGYDIVIKEDIGPQRIPNWAMQINPGPGESDQSVSFQVAVKSYTRTVSSDTSAFFTIDPSVSADGTLTFTPAKDTQGIAVVGVYAKDNGGSQNGGVDIGPMHEFTITIQNINDPPSFNPGASVKVLEDSGDQAIPNWATNIATGPPNEAAQTFQFILTTNNDALFERLPTIITNGTLSFKPAKDANGSASVSVILKDNGGTEYGGKDTSDIFAFTITVMPVNDRPSFALLKPQISILEDSGFYNEAGFAYQITKGPSNESSQTVLFRVSVTNPGFFSQVPAIASDGLLTFGTSQDAYGLAYIVVTIEDNGGTDNGGEDTGLTKEFSIFIGPVNDRPSFSVGPNIIVYENAGLQNAPNWAKNISSGAYNENDQVLTFSTVSNNDALFSVLPTLSPSGTLLFAPKPNTEGSATVVVTLADNGGKANGGQDTSESKEFIIRVGAKNNPPSFDKGQDQVIFEDSGEHVIANWAKNISAGPSNESWQILTFRITTTNDALFKKLPVMTSEGTLSFISEANMFGTGTVKIYLEDNGGIDNGGDNTSDIQEFKITILPINDKPSFTVQPDITVLEDLGVQVISNFAKNISKGAANEANQDLKFYLTINNTMLFASMPVLSSSGTLSFTPSSNRNGSCTLTAYAEDNGGVENLGENRSDTLSFTITVLSVNDSPSFIGGTDQVVLEDCGRQSITGWAKNITSGPSDEAEQNVSFIVRNDNPSLFSSEIEMTSNGRLTFTPTPNAYGSSVITLNLQDDGGVSNGGQDISNAYQFKITVKSVNDKPTFTKGADVTAVEDCGNQNISNWAKDIDPGAANESNQTLSFYCYSNNDSMFLSKPIILSNGTLNFAPAPNASGSALVSVFLEDNGATENNGQNTSDTKQFMITILPSNDAPTFTKGQNIEVLEDSGSQSFAQWAKDIVAEPNEQGYQTVTFVVTASNLSLFLVQPQISYDGRLTFTPAKDAFGTTTVSIVAKDTGGVSSNGQDTSPAQEFTITIKAVNDKPSFTKGDGQVITEDAGPQIITGWVRDINYGVSNEKNQKLTFHLLTQNTDLFSQFPTVDSQGTLYYTTAPDAYGTANITIYLTDDGGIENGGENTSDAQLFVVTITPINDPPANTLGLQGISGNPYPTRTLTAITETWNDLKDKNNSPLQFAYQWQSASKTNDPNTLKNIEGATGKTYTVTETDIKKFIRLKVTVTDNGFGVPSSQTTTAFSMFYEISYGQGDIDHNGSVGMADAILSMQIISDLVKIQMDPNNDINADNRIGIRETIYIMKKIGGF